MKFKYYLRGVGIGIIFTVIVMSVAHRGEGENNVPTNTENAQKELTFDSQLEEDKKLEYGEEKVTETFIPAVEDTQETATEKIVIQDSQMEESYTFTVNKGEYCWTVSEKLQKMGLIDDAKEFRAYMKKTGYENDIEPGAFVFRRGLTYEEIAKILLNKE